MEGDLLEREEVEEGWGWGGVFPLQEIPEEELPAQVNMYLILLTWFVSRC